MGPYGFKDPTRCERLVAEVVCPQCTSMFQADPGAFANCPHCRYSGGSVPGPDQVQSFAPPDDFLPSNLYPDEEEDEDDEEVEKPKETSRVALMAMILGFTGIVIPFAPPVAIGFGIGGLVHVSKNADELKGKGLAVIGIVFGVLTSIAWFLLLISLFAIGGRLARGG